MWRRQRCRRSSKPGDGVPGTGAARMPWWTFHSCRRTNWSPISGHIRSGRQSKNPMFRISTKKVSGIEHVSFHKALWTTLSQNFSAYPYLKRAYHDWSRCNGICPISGPKYLITKAKQFRAHLYEHWQACRDSDYFLAQCWLFWHSADYFGKVQADWMKIVIISCIDKICLKNRTDSSYCIKMR